MRLVDTQTRKLVEFISTDGLAYAILSHTWNEEEVTYQEMRSPDPRTRSKRGYSKIVSACQQAFMDNYKYIWIDTCCIDKSSSAELSESINSMFQYYANAEVCYVYLSDLKADNYTPEQLCKCRWFSRGWTLQELLAPRQLIFYDDAWNFRGAKQQFIFQISDRTGIPAPLLHGTHKIRDYSVAIRMSWAAGRETTRPEDLAYCLLGIFDVNMPMLYGEGAKAFRRLQEEIIKRNNDLTIFAWRHALTSSVDTQSLFAPNSNAFTDVDPVFPYPIKFFDFSITNKGLQIADEVELKAIPATKPNLTDQAHTYVLPLGSYSNIEVGIYLRKIGPRFFKRVETYILSARDKSPSGFKRVVATSIYILIDHIIDADLALTNYRKNSIQIPIDKTWRLTKAVPTNLWDEQDRIFLRARSSRHTENDLVLGANFVAHMTDENPIFHQKYEENGMHWIDLESTVPGTRNLSETTTIIAGSSSYEVTATFELSNLSGGPGECQIYQLKLATKLLDDTSRS